MSEEMKAEGQGPKQYEGSLAKTARLLNAELSDTNMQIIFIATDVTGKTPTHIHMQGPSKDGVLIGGMLSEAGRIIMSTLDQQKKDLILKVQELEERLSLLENPKSN